MGRTDVGRQVTVLESFRPNPMTNPYLLLLVDALRERIEVETFSWRRALAGRYDVLHLHWPEVLVRGRTIPRSIVRCAAFVVVLVAARLRRRAIVRTLHNVEPHEPLDPVRRRILALCDRWTTEWITLTSTTESPERRPSTTIPIGHYRGWYPTLEGVGRVPGRMLLFGLIRRYKGVEELVDAATAVDRSGFTLRIVGRLDEPELGEMIERACIDDERISSRLAYLGESELAREIAECQLVVLPFRNMVNSSSLLLALSLGRAVLVPRAPSTEQLESEVGSDWVLLYDGGLNAAVLTEALERTHQHGGEAPDLSGRDWDGIATAHIEVFCRAAASAGGSAGE